MMNIQSSKFNDVYWRENYSSRPYAVKGSKFEDYEAAYEVGHESYDRYANQSFEEVELSLRQDYESYCAKHGYTRLPWDQAKHAVRDAWDQSGTT
jgi:hypothetical protein